MSKKMLLLLVVLFAISLGFATGESSFAVNAQIILAQNDADEDAEEDVDDAEDEDDDDEENDDDKDDDGEDVDDDEKDDEEQVKKAEPKPVAEKKVVEKKTEAKAKGGNVVEKTAEAPKNNGIKQIAEAPKKSGPAVTVTESKTDKAVEKKVAAPKQEVAEQDDADEDVNIGRMLLLYIPNRLIDITDIITLKVGFGPQARLFLTGTEYCNFGGFYGNMYYATKGYDRQWGGAQQFGWGYNKAFMTNQHYFIEKNYGSYNAYDRFYYITDDSIQNNPDEKPFENGMNDFWRLGFELGWFVDLGAALHPVDIADAVLGFFFIDIKKDDLK